MNLQEAMHLIPSQSVNATAVKLSGFIGGSTAFAGLTVDLSAYSQVAQILANVGIFIGAVTALITFIYTVYKGKNKPDA